MDTKNSNQASPFQGLQVQLEISQQLIIAVAQERGPTAACELIERVMPRLDPFHAAVLRGLTLAMGAEAMGTAGVALH